MLHLLWFTIDSIRKMKDKVKETKFFEVSNGLQRSHGQRLFIRSCSKSSQRMSKNECLMMQQAFSFIQKSEDKRRR